MKFRLDPLSPNGLALAQDATVISGGASISSVEQDALNLRVLKAGDTMTGALLNTTATGNSLVWDTNSLVVDATNHRVGIGTASPGAKLDVNGNAYIQGVAGVAADVIRPYSGDLTIKNGAASSSYVTVLNASGNVGINNTNPGTKLYVGGSAKISNTNSLIIADSSDNNGFMITNSGANAVTISQQNNLALTINAGFSANTANNIIFTNDAASERVRIAGSTGYVGIGSNNPAAILHIKKSQSGLTTLGDSRQLILDNTNGANNERLEISFGYKGAGTYQPVAIGHQVTSSAASTKGSFYIATRDATTDSAPTTRLLVDSAGNVGIGTTGSLTYNLEVNGTTNFIGAATTTVGGAAGVGAQTLATNLYTQSRLLNLITNGTGLLNNNYNFTSFTFDAVYTYAGGGSFKNSTSSAVVTTDELIPVDTDRYYKLNLYANSTVYAAGAHAYFGIAPYDIDGNSIQPYNYAKFSGSTDTTLAAALNPGDTTVTLTNATGWQNAGVGTEYTRNFAWYGYTNAKGYTYPNYTYTRTYSALYADFGASGAWAAGGISGNVITLRSAWTGPAIANGTAVRNISSGSTYKYIAAANVEVPNAWTNYSGYIGTVDTGGTQNTNMFPYGTAYLKLLFLMNRDVAGNTTNISNVTLTDLSTYNLEAASTTVPGIVNLTTQSFTGAKTFASSATFTSGYTSPVGVTFPYVNMTSTGSAPNKTAISLTSNGASYGTVQIENLANGGTWSLGYQAAANQNVGTGVLTWNGNGLVGVGITNPTNLLHVNGVTRTANLIMGTSSALNGGEFTIVSTGDIQNSWKNTAGGADQKTMRLLITTGKSHFQAVNDAFDTVTYSILTLSHSNGNVGISQTTPTATLHLRAGTATASSAPLKLASGTALATPEDGAVEYHSSHLWFTVGSTRYQLDQQSVGGSGIVRSVNLISAPATAGATAATDYVYFVSGTTTLTLPTAVSNTNRYTIKNTGVATVTVATTSAQTIDGSSTASLPIANTSIDVVSDGSNWQVV